MLGGGGDFDGPQVGEFAAEGGIFEGGGHREAH